MDSLADSLSDEQYLEWKSVALIDGWFHGRADLAELISTLNNGFNHLRLGAAAEPKELIKTLSFTSGFDVLKKFDNFGGKKHKKRSSISDVQKILKARYGHSDNSHTGV